MESISLHRAVPSDYCLVEEVWRTTGVGKSTSRVTNHGAVTIIYRMDYKCTKMSMLMFILITRLDSERSRRADIYLVNRD